MKSVAVVLVLLAMANAAVDNAGCGALTPPESGAVYNILPFAKDQYFFVNINATSTLNFSLCTPSIPNCDESDASDVFANIYNNATSPAGCSNVAGSVIPTNFVLTNPANPATGFSVIYPTVNGVTLNVTFNCSESDESVNNDTFISETYSAGTYTVVANSYYGCAYLDAGQLIAFMTTYKYVFVAIFVLLGIFLVGWGLEMFKYTIFLVTAIAGTFASGSIFYLFTNYNTSHGVLWVVFFIAVLIGCVLGYLAVKFEKAGFFALGFMLGGLGGMVLFNAVLLPLLSSTANNTWLFYVVVILLGLVGGLITFKVADDLTIIATSFIGSYLVVRSFSVIIGGFPNEVSVANGSVQFTPVVYAYFAVIVILTIVGIVHQERQKKLREDNKEEGNMENVYKNMQ